MIFSPFFYIMVHLTMHVASEVRMAGPVQHRDMWATKQFVDKLKNVVVNTCHPKETIAKNYQSDESLTFCTRYPCFNFMFVSSIYVILLQFCSSYRCVLVLEAEVLFLASFLKHNYFYRNYNRVSLFHYCKMLFLL
jgi:hypothetical protein